jgi:hypothetical protein
MDMYDITGIYILLTLLGAVFFSFAFWLWMLVDCLKRKKMKKKLLWVAILLFLNIVGSVLYFFAIKNKEKY